MSIMQDVKEVDRKDNWSFCSAKPHT